MANSGLRLHTGKQNENITLKSWILVDCQARQIDCRLNGYAINMDKNQENCGGKETDTDEVYVPRVIRKFAEKCYLIVLPLSIVTKIHKYKLLFFAS